MKRIATIALVGLMALSAVSAQPFGGRGNATTQATPTATSIEGKLVFVDTYPAIQAKDKTYMLRMPDFFYYAYTDGIKEGATVKADGYALTALPGQDKPWFEATKIVINGKTYDFTTARGMGGGMMGYGQGRGMMGDGPGMMGGRGRW